MKVEILVNLLMTIAPQSFALRIKTGEISIAK